MYDNGNKMDEAWWNYLIGLGIAFVVFLFFRLLFPAVIFGIGWIIKQFIVGCSWFFRWCKTTFATEEKESNSGGGSIIIPKYLIEDIQLVDGGKFSEMAKIFITKDIKVKNNEVIIKKDSEIEHDILLKDGTVCTLKETYCY